MKTIPTVMKYMTVLSHTIGSDQTLKTELTLMHDHQIPHLPVLKGGQISGVLSDRDLKLAMSIRGVEADQTTVEEIATSEVFLVKPDSKLDEVVKTMAEKKSEVSWWSIIEDWWVFS